MSGHAETRSHSFGHLIFVCVDYDACDEGSLCLSLRSTLQYAVQSGISVAVDYDATACDGASFVFACGVHYMSLPCGVADILRILLAIHR